MNDNWPRVEGDLFSCPRALIGGLSLKFDGGVAWWYLHLRTKKKRQGLFDLRDGQVCRACGGRDSAFRVVGVCGNPKDDCCAVCFAALAEVFGDAGALAYANGQHAARGRVERACMADTPLPPEFAYYCHDIVGGHAFRFVDVEYAIHSTCHLVFQLGDYQGGSLLNGQIKSGTRGARVA